MDDKVLDAMTKALLGSSLAKLKENFTVTTDEAASFLCEKFADYQKAHDFKPGDLVELKTNCAYREAFGGVSIVIEPLIPDFRDREEAYNHGSSVGSEPRTMLIGEMVPKSEGESEPGFMFFAVNPLRYKPYDPASKPGAEIAS